MEASVVLLSVDEASGEGSYSFVPDCLEVVDKPADQIVTLLLSGVEVHQIARMEPSSRALPGGRPLTTDDLISTSTSCSRRTAG